MQILNLGCGAKTSNAPEIVNIDYSIYLRVRKLRVLAPLVPLFFRGDRLKRFTEIPDNIMVHNLAKGIPFPDNSVDAVYHSHLFEHLDRDVADRFLIEVRRVLKPEGIHRIVVPDFEALCRAYVSHFDACDMSSGECHRHDSQLFPILEQSVRREASGTSHQGRVRRLLENRILGDARRRGETHQWMYDRINLREKAIAAGYKAVQLQSYTSSLIPGWIDYGLDVDEHGRQYKPGSLYMEAVK